MRKDFWSKLNVGNEDECWTWKLCVNHGGYGSTGYKGKSWLAHRLAWTLANGPIPSGLHVCHKCDNPPCCNPNHLFLGTDRDNNEDMMRKCRAGHITKPGYAARGDNHYTRRNPQLVRRGARATGSKLTDEKVREMRRLHAAGATSKELAEMFSVTRSNIEYILRRDTWKHVA